MALTTQILQYLLSMFCAMYNKSIFFSKQNKYDEIVLISVTYLRHLHESNHTDIVRYSASLNAVSVFPPLAMHLHIYTCKNKGSTS